MGGWVEVAAVTDLPASSLAVSALTSSLKSHCWPRSALRAFIQLMLPSSVLISLYIMAWGRHKSASQSPPAQAGPSSLRAARHTRCVPAPSSAEPEASEAWCWSRTGGGRWRRAS